LKLLPFPDKWRDREVVRVVVRAAERKTDLHLTAMKCASDGDNEGGRRVLRGEAVAGSFAPYPPRLFLLAWSLYSQRLLIPTDQM
jgi:hypothetical protein